MHNRINCCDLTGFIAILIVAKHEADEPAWYQISVATLHIAVQWHKRKLDCFRLSVKVPCSQFLVLYQYRHWHSCPCTWQAQAQALSLLRFFFRLPSGLHNFASGCGRPLTVLVTGRCSVCVPSGTWPEGYPPYWRVLYCEKGLEELNVSWWDQWRTEGGLGFSNPPPRNSEDPPKLCQTQPDLWKVLKIAEFRTPTLKDVPKKGSKILKLRRFAIVLH